MSEVDTRSSSNTNAWEDLVVALLSVNQYSLERTYASLEGFRREGLTDPQNLAGWKTQEIEMRLRAAGCDRGAFMTRLFAERLQALGQLIGTKGLARCEAVISAPDKPSIEALLMPVRGVGPVVLQHFFILRGL